MITESKKLLLVKNTGQVNFKHSRKHSSYKITCAKLYWKTQTDKGKF